MRSVPNSHYEAKCHPGVSEEGQGRNALWAGTYGDQTAETNKSQRVVLRNSSIENKQGAMFDKQGV